MESSPQDIDLEKKNGNKSAHQQGTIQVNSVCILAFQLGGLMIMIIAAMFWGMLLLHYKATNQVYLVAMHEVEYK